jgi:serine/threonine-protein kinase
MLTGEPPFTGATVQAVVAKVISAEPQDIALIRRNVSPAVAAAVHRGLEKLPADRHASAAAFATVLSDQGATQLATGTAARQARPAAGTRAAARTAAPWIAVALVSVSAFAVGRSLGSDSEELSPGPVMATLLPDEGEEWAGGGMHMAISRDGREVAIVSRRGSQTRVVVRSLDSLNSRALPETDGASYLFWSYRGRRLGFFSDNQLRIMDLPSGAVRALCPAVRPGGAYWGAEDVINFVPERGVGRQSV